jgi:hypothetical protein
VTATLFCGDPTEACSAPFTLNATLTTQTETGTFFFNYLAETGSGTFPVETGISGTFNGDPISFVAPGLVQGGIDDFLFINNLPEGIQFCTSVDCYGLYYDGDGVKIFSVDGIDLEFNTEFANWSAVGRQPQPVVPRKPLEQLVQIKQAVTTQDLISPFGTK